MVGSSTPQQWLLQHYLKYADIVYLNFHIQQALC